MVRSISASLPCRRDIQQTTQSPIWLAASSQDRNTLHQTRMQAGSAVDECYVLYEQDGGDALPAAYSGFPRRHSTSSSQAMFDRNAHTINGCLLVWLYRP